MFKIAIASTTMAIEPWRESLQRALDEAQVAAKVEVWNAQPIGARYAVVWLAPPGLFAAEHDLRAVFNLGAGVERLLADESLPCELPLIRLVDAGMAPRMAEYVCFFLARITRGLHRFGPPPHGLTDWNADRPRGKLPTVGVMGLGAIGMQIASSAASFGYPVVGWSRTAKPELGFPVYTETQLDGFLAATNILVDVLPLTRATENLLDRARLSRLPAGSHVINIGRGATIDDDDLLALLDDGHLASAVLDVFRVEPLPPKHAFWHHPKVTVTPHLSGPTPRAPAARQIAAAIAELERGVGARELSGYVDRARGY